MAYKIICVDIDNNSAYKDCRCIKHIGIGVQGGGINKYTPSQIHNRISLGEKFYVETNARRTFLVRVEREGTRYVRTEPNDTESDNLLKQKSCSI